MCLKVYAGGHGDGEGTHISAYLSLMAGENDKILEWPLRETFSIEMLNQEKNENHEEPSVIFDKTDANERNSKVSKGRAQNAWRIDEFVKHRDLENESLPPNTQHLKDDTHWFPVTMTKQISNSKPWLASTIPS